ncbi:MAG: sigma-70 family RNA polymerase sigma factor [Bacteroidales bacterium]|nr:sigma-70 family RNA polymerase sigma factor [Bacteroidales bacterium]
MQDVELIEKIKNNDNQAFKILISKYKQKAFTIAFGFLHDKTQAEDVVQDVFIKFWEKRNEFELNAKFSTWLYRVCSNMSINVLRKNKFSVVFSSLKIIKSDEKDLDFEQQIEDLDSKTVDADTKDEHIKIALKNAINSLPKRQKMAFVLNKYQNFSYKEIAEIMELSLTSVESLLFRAKTNLQKKLLNTYKSINNI